MKGKLWKETICIYAAGTIISWAVREWQETNSSFFKKGLICHFLPKFVKSKAVGGFQSRLSTLVRFTAGSKPEWDSARCRGAADLGWCPSQGVLSLCGHFGPLALTHLDASFFRKKKLHVQFFICISKWLQQNHRGKRKRGTGAGVLTWFHTDGLPEGEASASLWQRSGSEMHITIWWPPKFFIWTSN